MKIISGHYEAPPQPPANGLDCRYYPPDRPPLMHIPWPYVLHRAPGKNLCLLNSETGVVFLLGWHPETSRHYLVELNGAMFGAID